MLVSTQLALSVVLNGVTSQVVFMFVFFINSSLCVRRRIMYHYGGSTGPGRPPAYAVSDGEVCRRERVHFNSSNSNETAKPDRKPMCWGQVS